MVILVRDIIPPSEKKEEPEERITAKRGDGFLKKPVKRAGIKISWKFFLLLPLPPVFIFAFFLIPGKAEIEIWPQSEDLKQNIILAVQSGAPKIDFTAELIPGDKIKMEKEFSREFFSSGKKIAEKKAEGIIRVYNNSASPQILIANTRFQAPLEKFEPALRGQEKPWFRTQERITVPAKGYKDVRVTADSPGGKYNINSSNFSIPGLAGTAQYTLVYGESSARFQGGSQKETAQVLSADLAKAKSELEKEAQDKSLEELLVAKSLQGAVLLEDTLDVKITESYSLAKAGDELEKFSYFVKIKVEALVFEKEDLEKFALEYLFVSIGETKEIYKESLKTQYSSFSFDSQKGKIFLSLDAEVKIHPPIDGNFLIKELRKKSEAEAEALLESQEDIQQAKIKIWPFWRKTLPSDSEKIKLTIKFE